jgi:hypothetical protein
VISLTRKRRSPSDLRGQRAYLILSHDKPTLVPHTHLEIAKIGADQCIDRSLSSEINDLCYPLNQ